MSLVHNHIKHMHYFDQVLQVGFSTGIQTAGHGIPEAWSWCTSSLQQYDWWKTCSAMFHHDWLWTALLVTGTRIGQVLRILPFVWCGRPSSEGLWIYHRLVISSVEWLVEWGQAKVRQGPPSIASRAARLCIMHAVTSPEHSVNQVLVLLYYRSYVPNRALFGEGNIVSSSSSSESSSG